MMMMIFAQKHLTLNVEGQSTYRGDRSQQTGKYTWGAPAIVWHSHNTPVPAKKIHLYLYYILYKGKTKHNIT